MSSSGGGRDPWAPPSAGDGGSGSSEPAKKQQRTSGPSQADVASTSSAPPQPQPPAPPGNAREVPDLGEDVVFEVLQRADARTLAAAACVSRGWRDLARDERLWEAACVREWADLGFSEQQLRAVVLKLGGFRRLHAFSIRPIQRQRAAAAGARGVVGQGRGRRQQPPARLGRDQVQLSLSLFSIGFFQNMPNMPPPKKKDEGDGSDKSGGGQCG